MKRKVIVGIHGVANKPPREVSEQWWLNAINEGLEWIHAGVTVSPSDFKLMYWADAMYVRPQSPDEQDRSAFKLTQPYTRASNAPPRYHDTWFNRTSRRFAKSVHDFLYAHHITFKSLAMPIIATAMKDLDVFSDRTRRFHGVQTAEEFLTDRLERLLREHRDASVMLIGHSLGSVIAYATLRKHPDLAVDVLVSLGSPLVQVGFKQGIVELQNQAGGIPSHAWPVVPPNIRAWKNFADWDDPVIMKSSASLRDYYLTIEGHQVIEDYLVHNDYTHQDGKGKTRRKPHNPYGYLRCPEVADTIRAFLLEHGDGS